MPRDVLDCATTPDGELLELAREGDAYVIRIGGLPLMSSAACGSEQAMARVAYEARGARPGGRVLVGGLGMGFTLRAALDAFDQDARVTVAELLTPVIRYNQGVLGPMAGHPLQDPRVEVAEGDVRLLLSAGRWDAILMDVDNGPFAFTTRGNQALYGREGVARMASALAPGGVLVVWSAYPSPQFAARLREAGLRVEARPAKDGGRGGRETEEHTLFVGRQPAIDRG